MSRHASTPEHAAGHAPGVRVTGAAVTRLSVRACGSNLPPGPCPPLGKRTKRCYGARIMLVGMRRGVLAAAMGTGTAAALLGGCSSADTSSASGAGDQTDGGVSDGSTGVDSVSSSAADTNETFGDSSGGEATGGEGTDGAMPQDGCAEIDCGGVGSCEMDADGAPTCVCDDGYAALGPTCVRCEPPKTEDLAMSRSQVSVTLTIDGLAPPASDLEFGELWLRDRAGGDEIRLGDTRTSPAVASVLAGSYELYYQWQAGEVVAPANRRARVATIDATSDVDTAIDLDVVRMQGSFAFDHVPAPASDVENGRVWLYEPSSGDEILLGETRYGDYDALVLPGSYVLRYEGIAGQDVAPSNRRADVGLVDVLPGDTLSLDIDIPTVEVAGSFAFDDVPAPGSDVENGRVSLVTAGGDSVLLGETRFGSYSRRVVPGSYDVVYEALVGAEIAPANTRAVLRTLQTGGGEDDINIQTVALQGAFTINGEPAPADATDDGFVVLRHASGDEVVLGVTSAGSYQRRVVAGVYDLYYAQDTSGSDAPRNANARLGELMAQPGASGDVDIMRVRISGEITLGGAPPPDSEYQDGHLFLREIETGDSVLLANTRAGAFAAPVVPGQYEIVYAADHAAGPLPVNTGAVIGDVTVDESPAQDFAIDVPVLAVGGAITLDGETPPTITTDVANLYLIDARTADQIYLGSTLDGGYTRLLTPGDYLLFYRVVNSAGLVPTNRNANLGCWHLQ